MAETKPLPELLKKETARVWGPDQQEIFQPLEAVMASEQILALFDPVVCLITKDFKIGRLRTTDYGRTRQAIQIVGWREYLRSRHYVKHTDYSPQQKDYEQRGKLAC